MGTSSSSLLDENRSSYIRGRTEAELKNFSPHYKRQYLVTFFSQLQDEVEQHKTGLPQLLKQREPLEESIVLYKENVLYYDDTRKWKERFVVVKANYSLECHDSPEAFSKGSTPRYKLQLTGGQALTTEEKYLTAVDRAFPDPNSGKEESTAPLVTPPGPFPVYLWLPYCRDAYFCFDQEDRHSRFLSILNDCIRHQNHDFLKKTTCEVQALLKAVQFYRQEKGHYQSWDMLVGNDVQVLANLVMEELLPTLQTELVPRLKGKKVEKKRVWFATVEAAYLMVQEQLSEGLTSLKEECHAEAKEQEAHIRANMDQIIGSRNFLASKVQAAVSENAVKYCTENVQPYLASILEELMGPISHGFQEARLCCEREMDRLCRDIQDKGLPADLKGALDNLGSGALWDCYQHVDVLSVQLQELRERFKFSNAARLVQCAQIDMQQLMENAAYTFEVLLSTALKGGQGSPGSDMDKVKQRVLKQYDYDSSTMRKKIFQEALVDITLPAIQRSMAPTYKPELQKFDQYIFADSTNFIQVENIYEDILLQILKGEISKVVKEAASMKKHNLFMDSTDLPCVSQASLIDSRTPPTSSPSSPAKSANSQVQAPSSPLLGNGALESQQKDTPTTTETDSRVGAGSTPSSEAATEAVVDTVASLSLYTSPPETGTEAGTFEEAEEVPVSTEVRLETDRAVYVKSPHDVNQGHDTCAGVAGGIEVKDASVPVGVMNDSSTVIESSPEAKDSIGTASDSEISLEPSAKTSEGAQENSVIKSESSIGLKENGTVKSEVTVEVSESGTIQLEQVKEYGTCHDCSADSTDASSADACIAKVCEASSDVTNGITDSGIASPLAVSAVAEEVTVTSRAADSADRDLMTNTEQGPETDATPTSSCSPSEGQPEEGAIAPPTASTDDSDAQGEEQEPPLDCIREIRDLVVEIIEVEELVQKPASEQP